MISRSKNNRERYKALLGAVTMIIIVTVLIVTGLFSDTFYKSMVGLSGASAGTGQALGSFSSLFISKASLKKENNDLKKQLAEKEVLLSDQNILAQENADLKAASYYKYDTGNISARVLSKPPFTPFDVLVIEGGTSQGVVKGDRVMIGRIYLGTVSEVSSDSSRVTLLSAPGSAHEAYVGDDALPVLLKGKGGGNFETSLPQGSRVAEGDLVFVYYSETPFQIGTISKVISDEDNTFITLLLTIPFNLYSLGHVEIISS